MIFSLFLTLNYTSSILNFSKFDTNTVKPSFYTSPNLVVISL